MTRGVADNSATGVVGPPTAGAWIRPLRLGGLLLENNLLQAPLAGYSCAPLRKLAWEWGRPGLLASEMISARALQLRAPGQERYLARAENEGPVAFQLWGRSPLAVAAATRAVTSRGAAVVDLNCGCPVRKVRAAGAGAELMRDPCLVGRLVRAMRANTHLPVSVKIRAGVSSRELNCVEVARAAAGEGADLLTVHGRHARESYNTPCRLETIARVVDAVDVPVVGNGDVFDAASAAAMFAATGCAGVMVGRACMGAPWVFAAIRHGLEGKAYRQPPPAIVGRVFLEHHDLLADLVGRERAVRQCRKLGCFYGRGLPGSREFRRRLNFCRVREELARLVEEFFGESGSASAAPTPRLQQ